MAQHLLFALLGVLLLTGGTQRSHARQTAPRPNILWITAEDLSPALGAYGDTYAVTPTLDRLAREGILYRNAYATAPICSPARSALITGTYATSMGTQHLRSETPVPDLIRTLPEYLRALGYYTTNNAKTDYNFSAEGRWDESGREAHWRHRPAERPFFSVFNFGTTHEGPANKFDAPVPGLAQPHDPARAVLPPYLPDTPEMRRIWAHYYDLVTVLDGQVGDLLQALEADGLLDETVVFFFSDHGFGLPRHKRWLYGSGLHVPLLVRIPPKYRHLAGLDPGTETDRLVSLVDLAPTVLSLAGVDELPAHMEGFPFLGPAAVPPREVLFGARSRADDVYDVSRAVREGRYLYIRHYMPHLPYVQRAVIFSDEKRSYRELNRLRAEGRLPEPARALFEPKPVEELYDLEADPFEQRNLAAAPEHRALVERLRARLRTWILQTRDTGFLHEAEMMHRARGSTPYEMARDPRRYELSRILTTAELVGDPSVPVSWLVRNLQDQDSGVRFWAATALLARGEEARPAAEALAEALDDGSPSVQITAAEALCTLGRCDEALPVLAAYLADERRPWVALHAARTIQNIGPQALPLRAQVLQARHRHSGEAGGRYKDRLYSMFIGFALDQTLVNLGATP